MKLSVHLLLSFCLMLPALVQAEDASPRLATLSAPLAADFADTQHVTQIGQYTASRVTQLQFKAGAEMPSHAATTRTLVIVLKGRGHFDFSGKIVPLHERQVLHMEPGEPHAVSAETDLELLVVRLPPEQ